MAKFQRKETYDYLDLMKEFECVKRTLGVATRDFTIKLPATLNEICKAEMNQSFQELVRESKHKENISFVSDKMRLKISVVEKMFKTVTDRIVEHIKQILKCTDAGKKVSMILMVGGFSESPFVQKEMKAGLPDRVHLLIPKDPGLAVLNGAVVYGREQDSITTRIMRYSYGVRVGKLFKEGEDLEGKRDPKNPKVATDVFGVFMKEGTSVQRGEKVLDKYSTSRPFQEEMAVQVYVCKGDVPRYTTDSTCRLLGTLTVKVSEPSEEKRDLTVIFRFGSTTLAMLAIENDSKKACLTAFSLQ